MIGTPVLAQVAPDTGGEAFGHCMVLKTTGADRIILSRWMVGALASAPVVAGVAKVEPTGKDAADRDLATLVTRLLTIDCVDAARAVKGTHGFEAAFSTLGELAIGEVTRDPLAQAALGKFTNYIDKEKMKKLEQ